ncbi:unnamed protein product, partial [marine sediment metagenome]
MNKGSNYSILSIAQNGLRLLQNIRLVLAKVSFEQYKLLFYREALAMVKNQC